MSYDVSRAEGNQNASCSLVVIKIIPKGKGEYFKYLVNIYGFEGTHFKEQALFLKQKVEDYKAKVLLVDNNGLGRGLTDFLVLETGEFLPYSVINDDRYDKYITEKSIPIVYAMQAQNKDTKNSDMINHFTTVIENHRLNLLVPEAIGMQKISTKKKIENEELVKLSIPYLYTDILIEEIMNLEHVQSGKTVSVKSINRRINKDKFSALMYGLYWIYLEEQNNKVRDEENNPLDYLFIN